MPEGPGTFQTGNPQASVGSPVRATRIVDSDLLFLCEIRLHCHVRGDSAGACPFRPIVVPWQPTSGQAPHWDRRTQSVHLRIRADLPTTTGPRNRHPDKVAHGLPDVPIQQETTAVLPHAGHSHHRRRRLEMHAGLESRLTPPGSVLRICMPSRVCTRCTCVGKRRAAVSQVPAHSKDLRYVR